MWREGEAEFRSFLLQGGQFPLPLFLLIGGRANVVIGDAVPQQAVGQAAIWCAVATSATIAGCGSAAGSDLRGGQPVRAVPAATGQALLTAVRQTGVILVETGRWGCRSSMLGLRLGLGSLIGLGQSRR